jgi:hypothetical protein
VTNNANQEPPLNATTLLVNARNAQVEQDVFQNPLATTPARRLLLKNSTDATGPLIHHNASKNQKLLPTRPLVNKNAMQLKWENAISKTTHASNAKQTQEIQIAFTPWTTARLLRKKENARKKN